MAEHAALEAPRRVPFGAAARATLLIEGGCVIVAAVRFAGPARTGLTFEATSRACTESTVGF